MKLIRLKSNSFLKIIKNQKETKWTFKTATSPRKKAISTHMLPQIRARTYSRITRILTTANSLQCPSTARCSLIRTSYSSKWAFQIFLSTHKSLSMHHSKSLISLSSKIHHWRIRCLFSVKNFSARVLLMPLQTSESKISRCMSDTRLWHKKNQV